MNSSDTKFCSGDDSNLYFELEVLDGKTPYLTRFRMLVTAEKVYKCKLHVSLYHVMFRIWNYFEQYVWKQNLEFEKKRQSCFLDKRVVHVMFHEFTSEFHDIMILHFVWRHYKQCQYSPISR